MSTTVIIISIGIIFYLIACLAILDIARKDFGSTGKKALWGLTAALIPFIGCVVYFAVGARQGRKKTSPNTDAESI